MKSHRLNLCVSALVTAGLGVVLASSASADDIYTVTPGSFTNPSGTYVCNGARYYIVPVDESGGQTEVDIKSNGTHQFYSSITESLAGCPSDTFYSGSSFAGSLSQSKSYKTGQMYMWSFPSLDATVQAFYKTNYGTFPNHSVTALGDVFDEKTGIDQGKSWSKDYTLSP